MTCKHCIGNEYCNERPSIQRSVEKQCDRFKYKAEYEVVKHGKWIWGLQGIGKMNCKCSYCQEWFPIKCEDLDDYGNPERETPRCPNCGAIMERSD